MPNPAPAGKLMCGVRNSQNDHAAVEGKRVDCLEAALRVKMDDPTFVLNRATCAHHKIGLFATGVQKACHQVILPHSDPEVTLTLTLTLTRTLTLTLTFTLD